MSLSATYKRLCKTIAKYSLRLLFLLLIGLIMSCSILSIFAEKIIFQPPRWKGMPEQHFYIDSGTERVACLYYPGSMPYVILYSHGNAEDLSSVRHKLRAYQEQGFSVIGYDYQGYGASSGKPSVAGACRNIEAVYKYLLEERKMKPQQILATSYSVGGGPACWLAGNYPIGGLILEAPFASAFQAVLPFAGFPGDRFLNQEHIQKCQAPLLIIHGTKDRIVPVRNGKKLYRLAAGPKKLVLVPKAGHYDYADLLGDAYWQHYHDFVCQLEQETLPKNSKKPDKTTETDKPDI